MKLKVLAGMLVATTAMALTPIDDLNQTVEKLLKPFNNNLTNAELVFTQLEVNEVRALKAGMNASYTKKGKLTDFALDVNELSYDYTATRKGPRALFDLAAKADLLAIIDQEQINELGPMLGEIVTDLAQDFLSEYGTAAEVIVRTEDEKYDKDGNLISMSVYGKVSVDLTRLPEDVQVEDVPLKEAEITLAVSIKGLSGKGYLIMNPDAKYFDEDYEGLKELIEKLLKQEDRTLNEIQEFVKSLDEYISDLVNNGLLKQ